MNFFKLLKTFSYHSRFSLGISHTGTGIRHALICRNRKGNVTLISSGKGIPLWIRFFSPLTVYTDTGLLPTVLKTEHIGNQDPDSWIDAHEEFAVPNGMTSDQVVNDYSVSEQILYSSTVSKDKLDQFISQMGPNCITRSISTPLQQLAKLYYKYQKTDYILWKLTDKGSVFGLVQKGNLEKLFNFWPGVIHIEKEEQKTISQIGDVLHSFSEAGNEYPVILFCPEDNVSIKKELSIQGFDLIMQPKVESVPNADHEAYALALGNDGPDLTPFETSLEAKKIERKKSRAWKTIWGLSAATLLCLVILSGIKIGLSLFQASNSTDYSFSLKQLSLLQNQKSTYDSLRTAYMKKAEIFKDKSRATLLMSDLQSVFPEGVWAEEISLSEIGANEYTLKIRALTFSSNSISPFLTNLNTTNGCSEVRVAYSENTTVQKKAAIRFLTECKWENR